MARLASTFLLLLLPCLLQGCKESEETKSMSALKMHIAQQTEESKQIQQPSPKSSKDEAYITDDMNEGVRAPSAHDAWQSGQEPKDQANVATDKKAEALQRIRQAIHTRHQSSGKEEGKQLTTHQQSLLKQADNMIKQDKENQAMDLYLDLCQAGKIEACHRFAFHLSRTGNQANASRFYQVSCKQGLSKSCNNLGWDSEKNGDLTKAVDYYSWACLRHHPGSCKNLMRANDKLKEARANRQENQLR